MVRKLTKERRTIIIDTVFLLDHGRFADESLVQAKKK